MGVGQARIAALDAEEDAVNNALGGGTPPKAEPKKEEPKKVEAPKEPVCPLLCAGILRRNSHILCFMGRVALLKACPSVPTRLNVAAMGRHWHMSALNTFRV